MVKKSIEEYCVPIVKGEKLNMSKLIRELIKDHPGSGRGDLASRSEEILRERFKRKRLNGHEEK